MKLYKVYFLLTLVTILFTLFMYSIGVVILPGVEIGDNAVIAAGAIIPKNTHVAANTTFLGA